MGVWYVPSTLQIVMPLGCFNAPREQGELAARHVKAILSGARPEALPLLQNQRGKRVVNVTTMRELELRPRPIDLLGVDLVRSRE